MDFMNTKEKINKFTSLLDEKYIFSEKLNSIYELVLSENYDEALYELEIINKRYPYMTDVYHLKIKIYCIKQNYELAEKVLKKAETLFAENEKIKEDREYIRKIKQVIYNKHLLDRKYDMLKETCDEDIRVNGPKNVAQSSYYYRALSYRMLKDKKSNVYYSQACKFYNDFTGKTEVDLMPYLYKALCYKDMKEYGKALRIVNNILQQDCNNKEALKIKISIIKQLKNRNI